MCEATTSDRVDDDVVMTPNDPPEPTDQIQQAASDSDVLQPIDIHSDDWLQLLELNEFPDAQPPWP